MGMRGSSVNSKMEALPNRARDTTVAVIAAAIRLRVRTVATREGLGRPYTPANPKTMGMCRGHVKSPAESESQGKRGKLENDVNFDSISLPPAYLLAEDGSSADLVFGYSVCLITG